MAGSRNTPADAPNGSGLEPRSGAFTVRTEESIRGVGEEVWERLAGRQAPPFLRYAWLLALESTGCVGGETGWYPLYLVFEQGGETVGACPAFVKTNSEGEFVFDHGWARFAEQQLRLAYYPKLVVGIPFTPATGPRLLLAPGVEPERLDAVFVHALVRVVEQLKLSGAHVLFPTRAEAERWAPQALLCRYGTQFHWRNAGFASFDEFLGSFNAKRRHQIRRERREVERQGIRVEHLTGRELSPQWIDFVYAFYRATVDKFFWGRRYLNRAFFEEVCARLPDQVQVVWAREQSSQRPLAGAFNLVGPSALYGRYWGALEERPFLHFEVCYYAGIEYCIQRGIELFEPGAGGEHKLPRGFAPTLTYSSHWLRDARLRAAVDDFCERERELIAADLELARAGG